MAEVPVAGRRSELEARLAEKSRKITDRFEVFESGVAKSPLATARRVLKRKSVRIGLAVGAGALTGLWLVSRSRKSSAPWDEGVDQLAERLAKSVSKRVEKGENLRDAVRDAVHRNPPVLQLNEKHGIIKEAIAQMSRVVSTALISEFTRQVSAYVDRRKDPVSGPDS